jgi:hypothetical protein
LTVPVGSEVVVTASGAALIESVSTLVIDWNASSCSTKEWLVVAIVPADGKPVMAPVAESNLRPVGKGGVTDHV